MKTIGELGVMAALETFVPAVIRAGQIALRIQDDLTKGRIANPYGKDDESRFTAALTPGDLVVENYLGAEVLGQFADVSFFGEEHELDQVSRLFPANGKYVVTLDPINGTLYYMQGVPQWDIIMTVVQDARIVGALVCLPYWQQIYVAERGQGARIYEYISDREFDHCPFHLRPQERMIQINSSDPRIRGRLEEAGYHVVSSRTDYRDGDVDWRYATHGILTGRLCGIYKQLPNLIDSGAVAMIAKEAGGKVSEANFHRTTYRGDSMVVGANKQIHDDIMQATA